MILDTSSTPFFTPARITINTRAEKIRNHNSAAPEDAIKLEK